MYMIVQSQKLDELFRKSQIRKLPHLPTVPLILHFLFVYKFAGLWFAEPTIREVH